MAGVRLEWDGKSAAVPRLQLPLQIAESVNAPRADRGDLFGASAAAAPDEWKNLLIWGDNLLALSSLADRFAGQVDLIYIDPPFDSRQDYKVRIAVGDDDAAADQELAKVSSVIEEKAYRDTWGRGVESYLQMLYPRLVLLRELLSDTGLICVHINAHVGNYVGLLLDDVFGRDLFVNEIIWRYGKMSNATRRFPNNHDRLLVYAKTGQHFFKPIKTADSEYKARFIRNVVNNKITYGSVSASSDKLVIGRVRKVARDLGRALRPDDVLFDFDTEFKTQDDVFYDISIIKGNADENLGYDTQKPQKLIERIVESLSPEGSIVLDCFAGSGTTPAVAEKLGRRWIAVDIGRFAIHTTRKRLLNIQGCKPFLIANLGRYERQVWQRATTGEEIRTYLDFVVDLYDAKRVSESRHVHGEQGARAVHVGAVDAPISAQEVKDAADEAAALGYRALDMLGWEFDLGLNELVQDEARARGIELRLRRIPREVMDPRVIAAGEVVFHELAYVKVSASTKNRSATVTLRDFVLANPELVPAAVRDKITGWADYIDYWAVDFTYGPETADTFHSQWQSYRTRADRSLELAASHDYDESGTYQVLIKVIDIFGNDTTARLEVSLR